MEIVPIKLTIYREHLFVGTINDRDGELIHGSLVTPYLEVIDFEVYKDYKAEKRRLSQVMKSYLSFLYETGDNKVYVAKNNCLDLRTILREDDVIEMWGPGFTSEDSSVRTPIFHRTVSSVQGETLHRAIERFERIEEIADMQKDKNCFTHFALIRKSEGMVIVSGYND